ncbi:hypothetical protein Save01_05664 [Streptomyces avermitilis]|uniref:DUF2637 domain-containing protein n=1 Tax=Streptomyces avermitilis (strain ATCC 31267 / DSM 46492 / JCM 5070 / NBRC 14893 / NCIMB 12804 / NRRL 8165 / MA-4680) TaxID=227882 RepID=Q82RF0_STRAW|nr:hypothetical protein SAVERM_193 [Streptomyces avermitilis MA-4680 = NBRC 14893]
MKSGADSGQQPVKTASQNQLLCLGRAQRLVISAVVLGGLTISGIGFAGSYTAVRALALKKGFGNFSYVFPIGIDAGICVLLAMDLLLTWIRIPFPLLRQTAWLLTAATIAYNGAAAWPDPLGTAMHAVIPILFVVAVEAARHAIGQIADITADKHMEGIRITRWLLSPLPTFLLWRRMKLWELRSYEQVIKLEQERLVYQARLHTRFGRAWRRKAPVESLMPLRLARYGVPLTQTAPTGLAAAGIEPVLLPPAPQPQPQAEPADTVGRGTGQVTAAALGNQPAAATGGEYIQALPTDENTRPATPPKAGDPSYPCDPSHAPRKQYERDRTAQQPAGKPNPTVVPDHDDSSQPEASDTPETPHHEEALDEEESRAREHSRLSPTYGYRLASAHGPLPSQYVLDHHEVTNPEGHPPSLEEPDTSLDSLLPQQPRDSRRDDGRSPEPAATSPVRGTRSEPGRTPRATPSAEHRAHSPEPALEETPDAEAGDSSLPDLTAVDHYYLAWNDFQQQHGKEPNGTELSAHLAQRGIHDRENHPIKPKTLTRYFLEFRIYDAWATHRARTSRTDSEPVLNDLAYQGITAQYNRPIQTTDLEKRLPGFERRWHALSCH